MWPLLTPEELLHDLFGARPLIELASRSTLSAAECDLLYRPRGERGQPVAWSESDIPLLDEAFALLGPVRRTPGHADDGIHTFGHVVIDEAQDLSPMQLRMIARRSLSGSMTVVGDIGQATGAWVPSSWSQVVEHLPMRRGWRLVELTVNYRTPAEIMDLAARVLAQSASGTRPPESVRATGEVPRVIAVARPDKAVPLEALTGSVARAVVDELDRMAGADRLGGVASVAPPTLLGPIGAHLDSCNIPVGLAGRAALDVTVSLLAVDDAKGLEFDTVVVVEPMRIAEESAQGLRALYVAFTRATQRLTVVHSEGLPSALRGAALHTA
jgi:superfamily I DNA/RNA helicase